MGNCPQLIWLVPVFTQTHFIFYEETFPFWVECQFCKMKAVLEVFKAFLLQHLIPLILTPLILTPSESVNGEFLA